jgi:cytochrome P450
MRKLEMTDFGDPLDTSAGIPYELFARLRVEAPVWRTGTGVWFFSLFDDVLAATKDIESFKSSFRDPGVVVPEEEQLISEIEEPRHGKIRRIVNSAIAAHRLGNVESFARETSHTLLERVLAKGGGELMNEFVMPLPTSVIATLLGVPTEDFHLWGQWSGDVVQGDYPTKNRTERGEGFAGAHPEFATYVDRQIAERRGAENPPNDFVTRLLTTDVEGQRLTDTEVRTLMVFLLVAGNETTRNLIGNLLVTMGQRPEIFRQLQDNPELIEVAVEESLRIDPPTAVLLRDCIRDTEIHGIPIRAGEKVAYGIASANRDESHYEDPNSFRLDRPNPNHHVAFGGGPHVCPGSVLARMEAKIAIEVFLEKVGKMKLAPDFVREKVPVFWANGPNALQVTLTRR